MSILESFPPIISKGAKVLILGSMPGEASLKAGQYYAHPQNQFWRIMDALIGAGRDLPYDKRIKLIKNKKIALWESLRFCERPGSLDSAIFNEIPNDFNMLFKSYPSINHVFFNGRKAESAFRKLVLPTLKRTELGFTLLPSSSPAHAGRSFEEKLESWRAILNYL